MDFLTNFINELPEPHKTRFSHIISYIFDKRRSHCLQPTCIKCQALKALFTKLSPLLHDLYEVKSKDSFASVLELSSELQSLDNPNVSNNFLSKLKSQVLHCISLFKSFYFISLNFFPDTLPKFPDNILQVSVQFFTTLVHKLDSFTSSLSSFNSNFVFSLFNFANSLDEFVLFMRETFQFLPCALFTKHVKAINFTPNFYLNTCISKAENYVLFHFSNQINYCNSSEINSLHSLFSPSVSSSNRSIPRLSSHVLSSFLLKSALLYSPQLSNLLINKTQDSPFSGVLHLSRLRNLLKTGYSLNQIPKITPQILGNYTSFLTDLQNSTANTEIIRQCLYQLCLISSNFVRKSNATTLDFYLTLILCFEIKEKKSCKINTKDAEFIGLFLAHLGQYISERFDCLSVDQNLIDFAKNSLISLVNIDVSHFETINFVNHFLMKRFSSLFLKHLWAAKRRRHVAGQLLIFLSKFESNILIKSIMDQLLSVTGSM
ncbi:hypothetical protein RCL1_003712 [Eukaryota sp. TZLM3-RCL]